MLFLAGLIVLLLEGHVGVATILGRGCDPSTRTNHWTALGAAAFCDHLPVCILLLSKAADFYALDPQDGRTALQGVLYGHYANPPLTPAVLEERRALLQHAYVEGPHPNAFYFYARWARRWPFVMVMVCYGFQPTAARRAVLLVLNPPLSTNVKIPPIVMRTKAQRRAFLNMAVFGHEGIWRIIASYI